MGGGGGAPGARAEIPLQAGVRTMVQQLSPHEDPWGCKDPMQSVEKPLLARVDAWEEAVNPWETSGERDPVPMLEEPILVGLYPAEE